MERGISETAAPVKGFAIPRLLAWIMVFAGIIIFLCASASQSCVLR